MVGGLAGWLVGQLSDWWAGWLVDPRHKQIVVQTPSTILMSPACFLLLFFLCVFVF